MAILSAVANSALRYALAESLALFWWRQALNGASLKDLHLSWAYATSFYRSILSGKKFNTIVLACIITTLVGVDGPLLQRSSSVTAFSTLRNRTVISQLSTQGIPYGYSGVIPVGSFDPTTLTMGFAQVVNDYQTWNSIRLNITGCHGVCQTSVVAPGFDERCSEGTSPYDLTFPKSSTSGIPYDYPDAVTVGIISFSFNGNESPGEFNASIAYKNESACVGKLHTINCTFRLATVSYPITITNGTVTLRPAGTNDSLSLSKIPHEGGTTTNQFSTIGGFYLAAIQSFGSTIILHPHPPAYWTVEGADTMRYMFQSNDQYNNCSITYSNPLPDIRANLRELIFRASVALSNASMPLLQTTPATDHLARVVYTLNPPYLIAGLCLLLANVVAVLPLYHGWWRLGRAVSMSPLETAKAFRSPLLARAGSNDELGALVSAVGETRVRYGAVPAAAARGAGEGRGRGGRRMAGARSRDGDGDGAVGRQVVDGWGEGGGGFFNEGGSEGARGFSGGEEFPQRAFEEGGLVGGVDVGDGGGYGAGGRLILCLAEEDESMAPPRRRNVYH